MSCHWGDRFDVLRHPLKGVHCIEASAGTGKTYSIVFLFLRLLVEKELKVSQILVVTYTNAAAEEIRGRIREKLSELVGLLEKGGGTQEPLLSEFCKAITDERKALVTLKLRQALSCINEAPVWTIHSFCRRVLDEFAFESRAAFDVEFLEDDSELWLEAVADFWRKKVAEGNREEAAWMIEKFKNPNGLWEKIRPLVRPDLIGLKLPDPSPEISNFQRFLLDARDFALREVRRRKLDEGLRSFDDLLVELDQALSGPSGSRLARAIRSRYPVALIDEFQDTDSVQYRIFRRIYISDRDDRSFVCLIGDPKQAIYDFRGADVFAYMLAKRPDNVDSLWTMDTNWRSGKRLVRAVNEIFGSHSAPFIYRDIPYHRVKSGLDGEDTELTIDGKAAPAICIRFLSKKAVGIEGGKSIPKGRAESIVAWDCAARIAELLRLAHEGRALLGKERLKPADIAVLVPEHRLGSMIQRELRRFNIPSVAVSHDSVFDSEDAAELAVILEGVVNCGDSGRIRAALATETMGWRAEEIERLNRDDSLMDEVQGRFLEYLRLWQRAGFLVFFMEFLRREGIVRRLAGMPAGERRLTNILHLAELIHQVDGKHRNADLTMRWFRERRRDSGRGGEREQLRLESDENLVQILTVHKSKGLEFPVVFCPFLWWERKPPGDRQDVYIYHDPETLELRVEVGGASTGAGSKLSQKENLAESVRLAYVALTRGKSMCVVHWGPINYASLSGMGWVLFGDGDSASEHPRCSLKDGDEEAMLEALRKLLERSGGTIGLEVIEETDSTVNALEWRGSDVRGDLPRARVFKRDLGTPWLVSSYSGLIYETEPDLPDFWFEGSPLRGDKIEGVVGDPVFDFPSSARAGSCIHEIFQTIDFPEVDDEALRRVARDVLPRYGLDPEVWLEGACLMIKNTLDTRLNPEGLRLREIDKKNRLSETEFFFRLDSFRPDEIREILEPYPIYRESLEGLGLEHFRGLMHGYIDLIFRWGGVYYVVDYKTNHLGSGQEYYGRPFLEKTMITHRYPLQLLIYTVALHRHLKMRVKDYSYDRHMGGVFYLFCRGMRPEAGEQYGVFYERPPGELVEALDRSFSNHSLR